jgi:tetratricopeptide (TPR) repeat protein
MIPRVTAARLVTVLAAAHVSLFASGCGSAADERAGRANVSTSASPSASVLLPVAMPQIGGGDAALRERVRTGYASLSAVRDSGAAPPAQAAAYGAVGKLLVAAELLEQAEPYLLNARALAPGEMAWPYYLAQTYRLRNDREKAIEYFEEALRLQPGYVPALVWLGAVRLDRGDPDGAVAAFSMAVSREPGSAAAHFGLGRAALAAGDHAGAREHLEAALRADPAATRAHYPLALAYRALGDGRQADVHLRAWQQAFSPAESLQDGQIYPSDPLMEEIGSTLQTAVAYETRGVRALDAGRLSEAIGEFREGLKVSPRDAALHQNLGTALYLAGDEQGARAAFEAALGLAPGYARSHFSLGLLAESSGRDQEALDRYTAAVRYDPTLADARFRLAEGLRRIGQAQASIPHYEQIVSSDSRASQARFGLAMALVRLRRYGEAAAALEAAVRIHPEQPGLPHALARLLAAAPDDAVRNGRRAVVLVDGLRKMYGPTPALLETQAMALAEVGRFEEAAARQREAIATAATQAGGEAAARMGENLRRYESGVPCRVPWADDDPVHVPPRASGLRF